MVLTLYFHYQRLTPPINHRFPSARAKGYLGRSNASTGSGLQVKWSMVSQKIGRQVGMVQVY